MPVRHTTPPRGTVCKSFLFLFFMLTLTHQPLPPSMQRGQRPPAPTVSCDFFFLFHSQSCVQDQHSNPPAAIQYSRLSGSGHPLHFLHYGVLIGLTIKGSTFCGAEGSPRTFPLGAMGDTAQTPTDDQRHSRSVDMLSHTRGSLMSTVLVLS